MPLARHFLSHLFFPTLFLLGAVNVASAQWSCPAGSVPVPGGGGTMCRCPDGSYAGIEGCRQHAPQRTLIQPGKIRCGAGYCPNGTKCGSGGKCLPLDAADCGNGQACQSGYKCSAGGGCVPQQAADCGHGKYCNAGMVCAGTSQCITQEEAARRALISKIQLVSHALGVKEGLIVKDFEHRNQRAIEYVLDNEEVRSAVLALLATRGMAAAGPGGDKVASVMLNIRGILEEGTEFKAGHYYEGSLHLTNQLSSTLLNIVPYGGSAADVLNVVGAVDTAYVYGFFWGT